MITTITDHGAETGTVSVQTVPIQKAIDSVASAGGGTVRVPAGLFQTGTVQLKSHVTLHLDNGAVLKGSGNLADYPEVAGGFTDAVGQSRNRCLIYAKDAVSPAITGHGTIDGNGGSFAFEQDGRPFMVRFIDCRDIRVTGVTLKDSPGWVSHYLGCENVLIHGVTIQSRVNSNNDGIDVDSCRRVRISDCDIDTGDDAICIKATRATPSDDIIATGCRISSDWGALKLGTESAGDFRNILFSNMIIRDTNGGGLKLISMDGCRMENVVAENLIMDNVSGPIFIRLGARLRRYFDDQPVRPVGTIRGVSIRNVRIRVWEEGFHLYGKYPRKAGIIVSGVPGHCVENVDFENVRVSFPGGGMPSTVPVPEQEAEYPEFPAFHPLPSWALFLRHLRGATFRGCEFSTREPDGRPALYHQDTADVHFERSRVNELEMPTLD
ncbi:MAG: glycoside hydrolase family 28 protein [Terrimicrobiaceae bacterium]|nr:glycoside hydrolase family 28 protein [Terrimicrobiaceae bacterium]